MESVENKPDSELKDVVKDEVTAETDGDGSDQQAIDKKDLTATPEVVADDENSLLFVLTYGTLVENWDKYKPTFRTMSSNLTLIDSSKFEKDKD